MAGTTRLSEPQRRALDRLSAIPLVGGFYLAGVTAIAMHLGHRTSRDLDFFSLASDVDLEVAKTAVRGAFDEAETVRQTDARVPGAVVLRGRREGPGLSRRRAEGRPVRGAGFERAEALCVR